MQLALQAMIVLTGNYTFFNLLTATLAVLHLDDEALPWGAAGALLATGAESGEGSKRSQRCVVGHAGCRSSFHYGVVHIRSQRRIISCQVLGKGYTTNGSSKFGIS